MGNRGAEERKGSQKSGAKDDKNSQKSGT